MPPSSLTRCIVNPSRIASKLDWKKNSRIMALDISNDRVGIAIAEHPNSNSKEEDCEENKITLGHTIPYMPSRSRHQRGKGKGKKIFENASIQVRKEKVKDELNVLIKEFGIVGFIVGWPLEPSGLPGANCGQVLHLLDFLAEKKNGQVVHQNRPLTLWDQRSFTHNKFMEVEKPQDKWGRSVAFCTSTVPCTSKEKGSNDQMYITNHAGDHTNTSTSASMYDDDERFKSSCADKLLEQFLNSHYQMDINDNRRYTRQRQEARVNSDDYQSSKAYDFLNIIRQYETNGACIESSLL